ncbi:MAG: 4-hydroxythreonine-4-phosphate dehydrogenase PdxA [Anaerolineae bacterium]|nr:4-hydroxythreonine-4-phosphate dehydrogenase PdxA [Anaerolineae bacterium]
MSKSDRPILAVTMGDASGVGPEVVARAAADPRVSEQARLIVVGDAATMEAATELAGVPLRVRAVDSPDGASFAPGTLEVLDLKNIDLPALPRGRVNVMAGAAAFAYLRRAAELALSGAVQGIVTAPLNKEALNLAGFAYAGHTEALADLTGAREVAMLLVADGLRVSHVSTHVALCEAIGRVQRRRIVTVARLTDEAVRRMGVERPRLAVAGLNPHAGEAGLFGTEEAREIAPAVEELRGAGYLVSGPLPPDTVFLRALRGEFDAVIAMYHDQGHIPAKLVGFEQGVNVTLGLPILRTSVDHGTAFDIAWTGVARPTSMIAAILLAARMAGGYP